MKPKEKLMSKIHSTPDFAEFLTDLAQGKVNAKLTEKLAEVAEAVEKTGKQGEVNVKFVVKKEGEVATVGCEVKVKVPDHPLLATMFHFGENGALLREDPRQTNLFKDIAKPALKTVGGGDDEDNEDGGDNDAN